MLFWHHTESHVLFVSGGLALINTTTDLENCLKGRQPGSLLGKQSMYTSGAGAVSIQWNVTLRDKVLENMPPKESLTHYKCHSYICGQTQKNKTAQYIIKRF